MKKQWERPELIVLTKSEPEEMVLQGCKAPGFTGPDAITGSCIRSNPPFTDNLGPCSAQLGT